MKLIIVLLTFTLPPILNAQEIREFYNGIRALGMGGVYVTTTNDETALVQQPAGLGRLRDFFFTVVDPEVSVGSDTQEIVGGDLTAFVSPSRTLSLLKQKSPGERLHEGVKLFPSAVFPNFGIGLYANYLTDAKLSEDGTLYELYYQEDWALVTGFNFRLFDGILKLGFNGRAVNHTVIDRTDLDATVTTHSVENLAKEGMGIGADVGLLLQAPWSWLPTLGLVYRDAGGTSYSAQDGMFYSTAKRPADTPAKLDVGIGIQPIIGRGNRMTLSVEVRDVINYSDEEDASKLLHAGVEFNFGDAFFLRAGMNQRYWTAGLEFSVMNYQFQLASYGEEVGTATANEESRRYVGKFAFRF